MLINYFLAYDKSLLVNNVMKDGSISQNGLVPKGLVKTRKWKRLCRRRRLTLAIMMWKKLFKELALAKTRAGTDTIEATLLTSDAGVQK